MAHLTDGEREILAQAERDAYDTADDLTDEEREAAELEAEALAYEAMCEAADMASDEYS